jgi:hypothetical protein
MTGPQIIRWTALLLLLATGSGCATSADAKAETGIRSGFETVTIGRVAVMPFVTSDAFSMTREARDELVARYEQSAEARLEALGFDFVTAGEIRDGLEPETRTQQLARLDLDKPLVELFESTSSEDGALEDDRLVFIREIAEKMKVDTVLIGQVVYHTDAMCSGDGSRFTPHVVYEPGEPTAPGARVPCAVSHFEAKLVHAKTGDTVWYNRALREVRAATPASPQPDILANADAAVALVLNDNRKGLRGFIAAK